MIKSILDLGARLTTVDSEGRTPLRLAVDLDNFEVARLLADSGSDVFYAARDGRTSAEAALLKGESMTRTLFSGSAINGKDSSGNTILHYAARLGNTSTISLLLALGAQKDVRNIAAESPAEIALRWRNSEAAALLF
jgi:ankyrin repeat protein